ncbi:MAG TPA: hypothetical protein VM687_11880 [Stenotrophomonas sp.]|nr:hypothetical protein [Stenotrophomonas sp.]
MQRHYFPGDAALESLAGLDTGPLRGTHDPMLATLHGLKFMQEKDWGVANAVLHRAATMGSIYAYEEAAVAEYHLGLERFGPSIDNDDILRARLEVARTLGDYKVDYLIDKYLPDYPMQERAYYVQLHQTVFLGKLGEDAQLRGLPSPGPDPRPNAQVWKDLGERARRDPATTVDAYVLE